ncbi:MAG: phospho-sugar mutase [Clostridiaceae bacterium]|nr:phospho-sugar mutase [Clostridiaceae bacterium]
MDYLDKYRLWLTKSDLESDLKAELEAIKDNDDEIKERFFKDLEFGTAGLRGILGAGTARMNVYTVRKATQGLADYINSLNVPNRHVAIAYDSRIKSAEFALEAAKVFAANGIKAYLFETLKPVPLLSFTIRYLNCISGVVVTASHNSPKYNGYKAYGPDGGQLANEGAREVMQRINNIDIFKDVKIISEEEALKQGLLQYIGEEIENAYLENVYEQHINRGIFEKAKDFKVVYTPFHGTGLVPVTKIFKKVGLKNFILVEEQTTPDGNFPTVKSPNPEEKEGFKLAIELAKKENCDLIVGTDPDCDRVGIVVRNNNGEYVNLTGNQVGALLCEYILSQKSKMGLLPQNPYIVKTVVTSEMVRAIAKEYNVNVKEVLTGFKFIAEKIKESEETKADNFVYGFEESYGYLAGTYCRDKDAVVASMLICEMAAYYSLQNMSLYEAMENLYKKYGYFAEGVVNIVREGLIGVTQIANMMKKMRESCPEEIAGIKVRAYRDYLIGKRFDKKTGEESPLNLPASDVLYYELGECGWVALRPSGTEPKLKIYGGLCSTDEKSAKEILNSVIKDVMERIS